MRLEDSTISPGSQDRDYLMYRLSCASKRLTAVLMAATFLAMPGIAVPAASAATKKEALAPKTIRIVQAEKADALPATPPAASNPMGLMPMSRDAGVTGTAAQVPAGPGGSSSLLVTNKPLSEALGENANIYSTPSEAPSVSPQNVMGADYYSPVTTLASDKIKEIREDLYKLQGRIADLSEQLNKLQAVGQELSASYYASVATINTQLQSGTTPGNPRLLQRLGAAQDSLDTLSGNVADLNTIALQIADAASVSSYLQESARAAYGLAGSVEEDHARLAQLEDSVSNTSVLVERMLNNVNDDISRSAAYLASERSNLRTLSLAIANGDLYGKSLSNRPFLAAQPSNIGAELASMTGPAAAVKAGPAMGMMTAPGAPTSITPASVSPSGPIAPAPSSPRPLVVIRFDRADVDFQQPVYQAVSEALDRYPNARFELVAVNPGRGNPAKMAIESSRARRNAEKVLRTLTQMGLPADRVDLSSLTNDNIQNNEVHLYIR